MGAVLSAATAAIYNCFYGRDETTGSGPQMNAVSIASITSSQRPRPIFLQLYVPFTFDFIKVKSYKGLNSVGSVQITGGDLAALEGKNVLVVEDVIDTGNYSSRPSMVITRGKARDAVDGGRAVHLLAVTSGP